MSRICSAPHYFPTANSDNNIAPGAPRTVKATVGYSF